MGEGRYRGEDRIIEIKKRKIESQKIKRKKTGAVNFYFFFIFIFYFYFSIISSSTINDRK